MRTLFTLATAAPLALLAACGDSTPADEVEPMPMETMAAGTASAAGGGARTQPVSSLEGVDFAGNYGLTDESGQTSRVTLRGDNTYDYTGPGGTTRSGRYSRMEDGRRILIEDFDGQAGYFSVGDGTLYRLRNADAAYDDVAESPTYRRNFPPMPNGGPGTVDTGAQQGR
jgi:hypothetical protein